ncbi:MAG: hypothetical protein ING03_08750 [Roseomonas sp.]|nr:hypothetical protein [Roseomonas sp.]MCA3315813.1 hypothetical protein [Roseomonas sp.]MCA3319660.1 hypothetical protein [Roseomonas sp.]
MSDLRICIDLSYAERNAIAVREMLIALRTKYALGPYEYCKEVSIAPGVLPYSHPIIRLNTALFTETALLANYIHEQMHWYLTWYSHKHTDQWRAIWEALEQRYPDPPIGRGEGADTLSSTHLHLIVNWLEIEALGSLIGAQAAKEHVTNLHYYRWIYASVIRDWQALGELYASHYLVPILPAHDMSPEDLALAARLDEA